MPRAAIRDGKWSRPPVGPRAPSVADIKQYGLPSPELRCFMRKDEVLSGFLLFILSVLFLMSDFHSQNLHNRLLNWEEMKYLQATGSRQGEQCLISGASEGVESQVAWVILLGAMSVMVEQFPINNEIHGGGRKLEHFLKLTRSRILEPMSEVPTELSMCNRTREC
ncbi:hypothetical protein BDZ45DRAFT_359325 [Acephala macrosclerotiorum]|nr:hypothetical protein BDZ45DRAFT_359325 [Acephala macrosclerotiorum]